LVWLFGKSWKPKRTRW